MYNVSENYIAAVRANTRTDRLLCTLTFPDDPTHPVSLTDADYGQGSISITWQCVDGEELMFGAAIAASMDISIRSSVNRYRFYGATLEPVYQVKTGTNTWESVPLGVFTISDAERVGSLVVIDALDNMQKLDKEYGSTVLLGTPIDILTTICEDVGITLGTTAQDIASWPNVATIVQIDASNGCSTYRDALKAVCQLIGAFAIVNRTGQLVVRQFHTTADTTLDRTDRYSSTVADYLCNYIGLSVTGMSGTYNKMDEHSADGLIMTISDAMCWDADEPQLQNNRAQNLFNYLQTIEYTPCEVSMPGDPSFDCGDMVEMILDADGEESINTIITEINWSYRNVMSWESVGQNPYVSGAVGAANRSSRVLSLQGEQNKVVMYTYRNNDDMVIGSNDETICRLAFATIGATDTLFYATIQLEATPTAPDYHDVELSQHFVDNSGSNVGMTGVAECDGSVVGEFTYLLNGTVIDYSPKQIFVNGKHSFVLFFPIQGLEAGQLYTWEVKLNVTGGTVKILTHDLRVVLWGQNLATAEIPWDGFLNILESIDPILIPPEHIGIKPVQETGVAVTTSDNDSPRVYTENLPTIALGDSVVTITRIEDLVSIGRVVLYYTIDTTHANEYTYNRGNVSIVSDEFVMKQAYTYPSAYEVIDDGALKACDCDVTSINPTSLMVVATGENASGGGSHSIVVLPPEYQELEYIEGTGSQLIDTGINANTVYGFSLKFKPVQYTGSSWNSILSGYLDNATLGYYSYPTQFYFRWEGSEIIAGANMSLDWHTFEADYFKNKFRVDDREWYISSGYWGTSSAHVILFNNSSYSRGAVGQVSRLKLFGQYGVCLRDLVPCYRKADNVIGMYDVANGTFFQNGGNGLFTAGPVVTVHNVPSEYQVVEYIESNGSQYIDTDVSLREYDQNLDIEIDAEIPATGGVQGMKYSGGGGRYWFSLPELDGANTVYVQCAAGTWATVSGAHSNRQTYKLNSKTGAYTVGQTSGTVRSDSFISAAGSSSNDGNIYLFGANNWYTNAVDGKFSQKLYGCIVKSATTGVKIREFVPCYRISDSVIGLYDVIEEKFFENSGTGTFSKGANVTSDVYKTLITDGTDVYSISSGALTPSVGLLANLSASMFQTYGFDALADCSTAQSDILALGNFSILRWCSADDETLSTMLATVQGLPDAQDILTPVFNIADSNVTGIELTTTDSSGNPRVSVKFDDGDWEYYDFTDEMWEEVGTGTIGYMTVADLENLTEAIWAERFENANTMQTKLTLVGANDTIGLVQYKFLQEGE